MIIAIILSIMTMILIIIIMITMMLIKIAQMSLFFDSLSTLESPMKVSYSFWALSSAACSQGE